MTEVHTLDVPGARLHYEVRGSGPVLVVVGSPMSAAHFAPLADALAAHHTVVTTDPRGIANSALEDPTVDVPVEQRADDVIAILDALGAGTADLFGSSGGATTGLALVARHPDRLRTLVAHEPPLLELLPDREARRAATEDVVATFHAEGAGPAFAKFMAAAGFVGDDAGAPAEPPPGPPPSEQDMRDAERFLAHDLLVTTRYVPDVEALRAARTRIVVGIGQDSGHLLTHPTSTALAERLAVEPTFFPGDHGGFLGAPAEFAEVLTKVLAG
ncbi:alpha/beta hydrolase [Pseudonocardia halophobica]|uniref:Hydrolase n=1 Tax=Pseudonocardia halophobica TaxID=29401 RepID=A0A9W6L219_9PSEU|nr:alpha/beta hydrolase [Pseudonocardia halophobica]GLL11583.1 hydrolase [Pseudonocardia halophobica]